MLNYFMAAEKLWMRPVQAGAVNPVMEDCLIFMRQLK